MLVQVKHRGGVFIQRFYYKNKGVFAKIRVMRNNKVQKQNIQQLLLRQTHIPRGQGATIPTPISKLHTNYY